MSKTADGIAGGGAAGQRGRAAFWAVPGLCALMGVVFLVAGWVGGQPWLGLALLLTMLIAAAAMALAGRRNEFIRGLITRGDERITGIDTQATAIAGAAVIVAVLIGGVVEMARGRSGAPFTWLAAVAGAAYIGSAILLRFRR